MDHLKNIFIFQRNTSPVNEMEKFQLKIVAQINSGEEITSAILGSINMQENTAKKQKAVVHKKVG